MIAPPPAALTASPARVVLAGAASEAIRVTNTGRTAALVTIAQASFALDVRGRPRVVARGPGKGREPLLRVRPGALRLLPRQAASVIVSATIPHGAGPGDHAALVLLTTQPRRAAVAVRMRLGVVVLVRVPGRLVHRLELRGVAVRRRGGGELLELAVANGGNVIEELSPDRLHVSLLQAGRLLARLRPVARELLPRTRGLVDLRYHGLLHGVVTVRVEIAPAESGRQVLRRTFRLRS